MGTWQDGEAERSRKGTARNLRVKRAGLPGGPERAAAGWGRGGVLAQIRLHPAAQSALLVPALVPRRHVWKRRGGGRGGGVSLLLLGAGFPGHSRRGWAKGGGGGERGRTAKKPGGAGR